MLDNIKGSPKKQILIVYFILTMVTLAVFWQMTQYEIDSANKAAYINSNPYVKSGITLDGIQWAFSNTSARFWHPLTWLSLMLDYQIHGLNAFGYNITNLILHILSTLLLFRLFNRVTGDIWKSAFVAALFALHPLQVALFGGSIHRRKDFLSTFFWMLTLCLYVYYTGKPVIKRYFAVLFSFICALMSKPMVVTLPVIMILFDYWPLGRFQSRKSNFILWQLKEKRFFFFLSVIFSVIAIYAHDPTITTYCPPSAKIANASVAYLIHLQQFFLWPHNVPLFEQLSLRQALSPAILILFISFAVIAMIKRLPYLFVGWFWYLITLLPVVGIVQCGHTDLILPHYAYLPSIGIVIILAWGIPLLTPNGRFKKIFLFIAALALLTFFAIMTLQMSSYYKNDMTKLSGRLQVTRDNYVTQNNLDVTLIPTERNNYYKNLLLNTIKFRLTFPDENKLRSAIDYYNKVISHNPDDASAFNNRGTFYNKLGQHELAIVNYNQAIRLKPDYSIAYNNRGITCYMQTLKGNICSEEQSYRDFEKACSFGNCQYFRYAYNLRTRKKTDNTHSYDNRWTYYYKCATNFFNKFKSKEADNAQTCNARGIEYSKRGEYKNAINDFNQAIRLKPDFVDAYNNRGLTYFRNGQNQLAIDDFNRAILLKPDMLSAYINRGAAYLTGNKKEPGCLDAQKACALGNCELLKMAKEKGYCN